MLLVNRGHVRMGIQDDNLWGVNAPIRDISVDDFWMDKTEVTNAQYRAFIQDVCDSISVIVSVGDGSNNMTVEGSKYASDHTLPKLSSEPINITIYYDINGTIAIEPVYIQFADIYLRFRLL